MRVEGAGGLDYACPFTETYRTATATHETRRGVLVHVATDEGILGLGEAAPLSNRTEPLEACQDAVETAVQRLQDDRPPVDEALDELDEIAPSLQDAPAARFGVCLALADALAKIHETPLAELLAQGYLDGRTPATQLPVNATIPDASPEATHKRARQAADEGFDTIKLKAARGSFAHDVQRIEAVEEAAPGVAIRLDVNGAWPELEQATARLQHLESYPIEYVEQPLPADDIQGMVRLRSRSEIPVAADEPVRDVASARALILARASDVLVLKPMVLGGLDRTLQLAQLAHLEAIDVVVTTTIDAAVARAGTLQLAAALGKADRAHGLATGAMLEDEPASFDERIEDGRMHVPRQLGHGARRESGETRMSQLEEP